MRLVRYVCRIDIPIMNSIAKISIVFALLTSARLCAQEQLSIIPKPLELEQKQGTVVFTEKTVIQVDDRQPELRAVGELLLQGLFGRPGIGAYLTTPHAELAETAIRLQLTADTVGDVGYRMFIDNDGITAHAEKVNGLFYAIQSIYQLLPVGQTATQAVSIPAVEI